nr:F-box/LRR-repeat protein 3 [Tanacetum cinerariifolium]
MVINQQILVLDVSRCELVSSAGLISVTRGCKGLQKLDELSATVFHTLKDLKHLKTIRVDGARVTDSFFQIISTNCLFLVEVGLSRCEGVNDLGIMQLAYGSPTLKILDLTCCNNLTDIDAVSQSNCSRDRDSKSFQTFSKYFQLQLHIDHHQILVLLHNQHLQPRLHRTWVRLPKKYLDRLVQRTGVGIKRRILLFLVHIVPDDVSRFGFLPHLPLQLELSDPFPDLPDLVLYFKIPDSSPESFDLRDIPWVTIHLLVASVGGSTVMVEAISTSTGVTIMVSEPGFDTVGSKDLTCEDWNALQTLLPQIRAEIREEFRTSSGPSDAGGNPPPVTIHTWLERFNKQKPYSFEKATAPVDAENWISHMEKIFDVMGCEEVFKRSR